MHAVPLTSFSDRARLDHFWRFLGKLAGDSNIILKIGGVSYHPIHTQDQDTLGHLVEKIAEMEIRGEFLVWWIDGESTLRHTIELKKFLIRKRFLLGDLYCYRAGLMIEEPHNGQKWGGYLIGKNLSDVLTRALHLHSQRLDGELLTEDDARRAMVVL